MGQDLLRLSFVNTGADGSRYGGPSKPCYSSPYSRTGGYASELFQVGRGYTRHTMRIKRGIEHK
jgi:hypothetical protein